ncbi:hypothetical protein LOK49_LG15G00615 [Camellia lanceoleosa]|uniref:Uncharacterized protein n=1 Tax=Camellia lanceoleosa TaxID=1840588 RepID=A0ACC0F6Q3_9ERIC|nr:hypothetical protein LOK49_LG15G00615 [Camellia lanceoleosa]
MYIVILLIAFGWFCKRLIFGHAKWNGESWVHRRRRHSMTGKTFLTNRIDCSAACRDVRRGRSRDVSTTTGS